MLVLGSPPSIDVLMLSRRQACIRKEPCVASAKGSTGIEIRGIAERERSPAVRSSGRLNPRFYGIAQRGALRSVSRSRKRKERHDVSDGPRLSQERTVAHGRHRQSPRRSSPLWIPRALARSPP